MVRSVRVVEVLLLIEANTSNVEVAPVPFVLALVAVAQEAALIVLI